MTMTTSNNISELLTTIKSLREKYYHDLPEELVTEIVFLEESFFNQRLEVRNRIEKLVDTILQQGSEQC